VLTQPVAKDLQLVGAAIKINGDLEPMGDVSVNIARSSLLLLGHFPPPGVIEIPEMAWTRATVPRYLKRPFTRGG
jgi:phosphate transport system protein